MFSTRTEVVRKLIFILSKRTCNAIYRNSNEAHVFCVVLPFQQASVDVCTLNRFRVTAGFVKTIVRIPPTQAKK